MNYIKNNYDEFDDPFENDYPNRFEWGSSSDSINGYCIPWEFDTFLEDDDCRNNYGL